MSDTEKARQLFLEAVRLFDASDYANAELRLREALGLAPGNSSILTNLAMAALRQGKFDDAADFSGQALAANTGNVEALIVRATCRTHAQRFAEAVADYDKIIALEPRIAEIHSNRAHALNGVERHEEALASCDAAIALQPSLADAYNNRGNALVRLRRCAEALDAFDAALRLKPGLAEAYLGRGNALVGLKRYEEAIAAYDASIGKRERFAAAWLGRGAALADLNRFGEAHVALDRALALDPRLARAWLCRGNMHRRVGRHDEALAAFDSALALDPEFAEAWQARGETFADLGRYDEARSAYDQAFARKPDLDYLASSRAFAKRWLCDWSGLEAECSQLIQDQRNGRSVFEPLTFLAVSSSAADQLECASLYAAANFAPSTKLPAGGPESSTGRLRIAYVSPDFRDHPVSFLMAGVLEQHDKDRFDIFAISLSADRQSAMRRRIMRAVTEFVDVDGCGDADIVELVRSLKVDAAVDLAAYTLGGRPNIFARRVAPIQVSYLGFPGTTGAPFIDYILADPIVIPADAGRSYSERIVRLPDTFQANDSKRPIADQAPTRLEALLPENGFVFCAFHSSYKLTPAMFDIWTRLLRQVDGSVLWLVSDRPSLVQHLREEAVRRDVDPDRLVFAGRLPYAEHLARQRLADLFLDTLPFNGGTTTSDALWAGLPVVTLPGEAFASRMSASLLNAVGLPELVAQSPVEYESLALRLARDPASLAAIRAKLVRNRTTHPLFDTVRFTRHLEAAYMEMWQRHRRGEPPESFSVRAID